MVYLLPYRRHDKAAHVAGWLVPAVACYPAAIVDRARREEHPFACIDELLQRDEPTVNPYASGVRLPIAIERLARYIAAGVYAVGKSPSDKSGQHLQLTINPRHRIFRVDMECEMGTGDLAAFVDVARSDGWAATE